MEHTIPKLSNAPDQIAVGWWTGLTRRRINLIHLTKKINMGGNVMTIKSVKQENKATTIGKLTRVKAVHPIEKIPLSRSDAKTVNKLEKYFTLPRLLINLLESSPNTLTSEFDAKLFLLTKINEIKHLINFRDPETLNGFIALWIKKNPVIDRLSFSGGCSIQNGSLSIFTPEMGSLAIADPNKLQTKRKDWKMWLPNFDIVQNDGRFHVEIPYIQGSHKPQNPPTSDPFFGLGAGAIELFKAFDWALQQQEKISRALVIADSSRLEGRSVQGGAPSLGKHRR